MVHMHTTPTKHKVVDSSISESMTGGPNALLPHQEQSQNVLMPVWSHGTTRTYTWLLICYPDDTVYLHVLYAPVADCGCSKYLGNIPRNLAGWRRRRWQLGADPPPCNPTTYSISFHIPNPTSNRQTRTPSRE